MSKKKYRIYKAGGAQQGRVMNPTAMWFAQMGAQQPSEEEMMMMQQEAQQSQQQGPSEEELMGIMQTLQKVMESGENPQVVIAQMLEGQLPPEIIIQALIQIGAPTKDAEALVMTTIEQMQAAQSQEQSQPQMSEEEMMAMQQQQAMAQQEAPQQTMYAGGISKANYVKKKLKEAKVGMSMDEESEVGSATNFAANTQPVKNALLNFNRENIIRNNASNEFDNMQMAQDEMSAYDNLEQARFGRGRARRQARRDARQDRQLDRTVRKAFGDIAFPAGVAPVMMPGAPMMGGAPSVLDMEVHRGGLFNRIKEVKMHMENTGAGNMPVNFAQGMFMNGLYNPMSMQGSGDFMYNITYPGSREDANSNVTGQDNDFITIPYPDNSGGGNNGGGGNNDGGKNNTEPTTNTKPEGGCGEGMKWDPNTLGENGLAGKCVEDKKVDPESCSGGRVYDPLAEECKCKDPKTPLWDASSGKCVAENVAANKVVPDTNYLLPAGLLATLGVAYVNREKIAKYLVDKGVKKGDKKAIQEAIQEISDNNLKGYFSNIADDAMEPLVGQDGQLLMGFFDDAQSVQGPQDMRRVGTNVVEEAIPPVNPNRPSGPMFDYPEQAGPKQRPTLQVPEYSNRQKRTIRRKYNAANKKGAAALEALAKEYKVPIGTPKAKAFSQRHLKTALKKFFNFIKEDGGAVDSMDEMYGNPDLYKFTGGGQGVDYFEDGGYYEDGGSTNDFEIMGEPAYKNVYDPYMNNGMTGETSDPPRYTVMTLATNPVRYRVVDQNFKTYGTYATLEEANARIVQLGGDPNINIDPGFNRSVDPRFNKNMDPGIYRNIDPRFNNKSIDPSYRYELPRNYPMIDTTRTPKRYNLPSAEKYLEDGGSLQKGQELYMPAEEIARFMAAGGVVEFLD